jgi:hypothetical protein
VALKRIALAGLALAVLAGVIVLAISASRSGADGGRADVRVAEASGRTEVVEPRATPPRATPPADTEPVVTEDGTLIHPDGTRETVRDDGTVVRDHRGTDQPTFERKVAARTDIQVRADLRPLFKQCGIELRKRNREARGRIQAVITTSIHGGKVHVDALDLQVEGLDDSEYTDCVRAAVEGAELDAPTDQRDVPAHTVTIQFGVP